jgi:hypothetical protein
MSNFQNYTITGGIAMDDKYLQLKEGMEFKSYKDLCKFLDVKPADGNTKKSHIKQWERHFEFEKIGNKYKILAVYPEPLFNIQSQGMYTGYIQKLFLDLLYCQRLEGKTIYRVTTGRLLYLLNMVNSEYGRHKRNHKELSKLLDIEEKYVNEFYMSIGGKLSSTLKYSLKKLVGESYILMQDIFIVVGDFGSRKAVGKENEVIMDIIRKALDILECQNEGEVFKKCKDKQYYALLNKLTEEEIYLKHTEGWYKAYEFTFTDMILNKLYQLEKFLEFDKEENRKQLNQMLVDNYKESYSDKYIDSSGMSWDSMTYKERFRSNDSYVSSGKKLVEHTIKSK